MYSWHLQLRRAGGRPLRGSRSWCRPWKDPAVWSSSRHCTCVFPPCSQWQCLPQGEGDTHRAWPQPRGPVFCSGPTAGGHKQGQRAVRPEIVLFIVPAIHQAWKSPPLTPPAWSGDSAQATGQQVPQTQHLIGVGSWRLAWGPERGPPPSLQPLLSTACWSPPGWPHTALGDAAWEASGRSRFSLPLGQGPASALWRGPLGMVRASSCSQWLFVTHMPRSALSSPPTG